MVIFGGAPSVANATAPVGDMWAWNGKTWTQIPLTTPPSARLDAAMVYDKARHRLVLQGGYTGNFLNDTWEYGR
jgi:hypothetical protein